MIPTSMTVNAVLGTAGTTITEFSSLILFVVGLGFGIWGVRFVIARAKRARG